MNSYVILLTACINPNGMSFTYLQDSKLREKQYIDAIDYYLTNTNYKIVFCNNSGEDISSKFSIYKDRIEFLSFLGNDYDKNLGKGYGEYLILQYAFQHSEFFKTAKYIIKITGRLIINNIQRVLKFNDVILLYPANKVYYTILFDELKMIDSRCFVAVKKFYEVFLSNKNTINDTQGYYFEHLLYDTINENKSNFLCCGFSLPLEFCGMNGSYGQLYYSKKKNILQNLIVMGSFCKNIKYRYKNQKLKYVWISMISFISYIIQMQKFILKRLK